MFVEIACFFVLGLGSIALIYGYGLWSLPSLVGIVFALGFGLRAIVLETLHEGIIFGHILLAPGDLAELAFSGVLSFLSFLAGIGLFAFLSSRPLQPVPKATAATPLEQAVSKSTLPYSLPMLFSFYLAVVAAQMLLVSRTFGGLLEGFVRLSQRSFTEESFAFASNLSFLSIPVILLAITQSVHTRSRVATIIGLTLLLCSLPWITVINGRSTVLVVLWSLMLCLSRVRTARVGATLLQILTLAAFSVFAIVAGLAWRRVAQSNGEFMSELAKQSGQILVAASDALPLIDHFRVAMEYASVKGFDYGGSLFASFTVLVPRSIWPDKPSYLPQLIARDVLDNPLSGMPPGLQGEGFIAAGFVGVLLYSFAFGFLVGLGHDVLRRVSGTGLVITTLAYVGTKLVLGILRTGPQGGLMAVQISLLFIPGLFVVHFLSVRRVTQDTYRVAG